MAMEIELKAHIKDYDALKRVLLEKARYMGSFEKDDTYWYKVSAGQKPGYAASAEGSVIRIRREKRSLPEGSEKKTCIATYKVKEVWDGIEVNDEQEFELVSSSGPEASAFEGFLRRMGLEAGFSKTKRGWAFYHDGINTELSEVVGLGWFLELEILLEGMHITNPENEKKRLLDFLDSLGIEREAIESRYYSEISAIDHTKI